MHRWHTYGQSPWGRRYGVRKKQVHCQRWLRSDRQWAVRAVRRAGWNALRLGPLPSAAQPVFCSNLCSRRTLASDTNEKLLCYSLVTARDFAKISLDLTKILLSLTKQIPRTLPFLLVATGGRPISTFRWYSNEKSYPLGYFWACLSRHREMCPRCGRSVAESAEFQRKIRVCSKHCLVSHSEISYPWGVLLDTPRGFHIVRQTVCQDKRKYPLTGGNL